MYILLLLYIYIIYIYIYIYVYIYICICIYINICIYIYIYICIIINFIMHIRIQNYVRCPQVAAGSSSGSSASCSRRPLMMSMLPARLSESITWRSENMMAKKRGVRAPGFAYVSFIPSAPSVHLYLSICLCVIIIYK